MGRFCTAIFLVFVAGSALAEPILLVCDRAYNDGTAPKLGWYMTVDLDSSTVELRYSDGYTEAFKVIEADDWSISAETKYGGINLRLDRRSLKVTVSSWPSGNFDLACRLADKKKL